MMRWSELVEVETAQDAAKQAAKEKRKREQIDNARRAQSDAARKYQNDMASTNDRLNSAKADLAPK